MGWKRLKHRYRGRPKGAKFKTKEPCIKKDKKVFLPTLTDEKQVKEDAQFLLKRFHEAKTREEKLKIKRMTISIANKSKSINKAVSSYYKQAYERMLFPPISKKKLKEFHKKRTIQAQRIDEALRAKQARNPEEWLKSPNTLDISGIDLPFEWRSEYEVKRLRQVEKDLKKYKRLLLKVKKQGKKEEIKKVENLIVMLEKSRYRLKWQEKHPFIEAGYDYSGIRNYEYALKHKIDYGFNLQKPQQSFLNNYHLKKKDIIGLRIQLEPHKESFKEIPGEEKAKGLGFRTRAYYRNGILHLPPTEGEKTEKTAHTILHEIGHHVWNRSERLRRMWSNPIVPLKAKKLLRNKKYRLTGETKSLEIYPWSFAVDASDYFMFSGSLDVGDWELHTILAKGKTDYKQLSLEGWAQTFASYRSGRMKRDLKQEKKDRDLALRYRDEAREKLAKFKGDKRSREYRFRKRILGERESSFKIADAVYENRLTFYNWLRKADANGWYIG